MAKKASAESDKPAPDAGATTGTQPAEEPKKGKAPKAEKADKAKPAGAPGDKAAPTPPATPTPGPAADGAGAPTAPTAPAGDQPTKKKGKRPGVPPRLGKKLRGHMGNIRQNLAKQGAVPLAKAVSFLKQNKRAKFDETVEIHMSLGIDPKQSDQMVRGSVPLPHGIGKSVRLVVFAQGDNAAKAKEAGADYVGAQDIAEKIQKENWFDFDVALATQDMMGVVGRLGKVLGPRGLMPSPKAGTVIQGDVATAIKEFKAGKVEFRADGGGNVHAPVGKMSFEERKLNENIQAFIDAVRAAKPAAAKGVYIKSVTVSATMSPGVPVTL
jgi:large subunit ribosomal protein L1